MIPPGNYPPNPQLPLGYAPAGQVVPVPATVTPGATPIDFSGGFQPPMVGGGENEEVSPSVATPTYPPPGAPVAPAAPFDGGRPCIPLMTLNAPQGQMPAAPMPTQPTGDPNAASSAAAAARARLAEAQRRANEAQQPPK